MKGKDNEYIYYKHYIIEEFKRKIRKGKNNENKISDWYKSNEKKNIKYTGNYSYKMARIDKIGS